MPPAQSSSTPSPPEAQRSPEELERLIAVALEERRLLFLEHEIVSNLAILREVETILQTGFDRPIHEGLTQGDVTEYFETWDTSLELFEDLAFSLRDQIRERGNSDWEKESRDIGRRFRVALRADRHLYNSIAPHLLPPTVLQGKPDQEIWKLVKQELKSIKRTGSFRQWWTRDTLLFYPPLWRTFYAPEESGASAEAGPAVTVQRVRRHEKGGRHRRK